MEFWRPSWILKMPLGKILHTLWKLLPLTHMNQNQSSKKLYTTFPPFVKSPPDYNPILVISTDASENEIKISRLNIH